MGRFYRYASHAYGLPIGPSALPPMTPATVPLIRTSAQVAPDAMPPPPEAMPAAPAAFPPYQIRPEVIGAPVEKSIVPPLFNRSTLTSLFPNLTMSSPVPALPAPPLPSGPVPPPSPVQDIFNTHAGMKAQQAAELDRAAQVHADIATDLQQKADAALFNANQAQARASVDPSFDSQAAAAAAAARASDAQAKADTAATKAIRVAQQADASAASAQKAINSLVQSTQAHDDAYASSVAQADTASLDHLLDTPGAIVPPSMMQPVAVPGFSVTPVVAAGGVGVVGFLLGGARGGLIGALLGGAATYFLSRLDPQTDPHDPLARLLHPSQGFVTPQGTMPMPSGGAPVAFEFTPYQMPDGAWISSAQDEAAYYASHPLIR